MWLWGERALGIPAAAYVSYWVWKVENLTLAFPTPDLGFHPLGVTSDVFCLTLVSGLPPHQPCVS